MELVTLKTFDSSVDAHLLKATLASKGIESVLIDDLINQVYPFGVNGTLGIRLQVRREDGERALKIVQEINASPHTREDGSIVCCPRCQSLNVKNGIPKEPTDFKSLLAMIIGFFTGFVTPPSKTQYMCYDCNHEFE